MMHSLFHKTSGLRQNTTERVSVPVTSPLPQVFSEQLSPRSVAPATDESVSYKEPALLMVHNSSHLSRFH